MIDLSGLEADGFESLCYDLLERLGLHNLQWRRGQNKGCSTSDSGRDIEGERFRDDLDGTVVTEKWFIECKHWEKAVPPTALSGFFTWADAERPDVAVVISSGALSNPAHDWIKTYRINNNPPYLIKTWEQKSLAALLPLYPDILVNHGIAVSFTSPPMLALWSDLKVHSLEHLFGLLDAIPDDQRDKLLGITYQGVLPLRVRKSETGKEKIRDLLIDPPNYDKFKRRCYELVNEQDVSSGFLSHAIAASVSRWLAFFADPFETEQAIKRSNLVLANFKRDLARLEAGEDVALPVVHGSREDHIDSLRKCIDDLRSHIDSSAESIAKHRETLDEWEQDVVIPFLNEDQSHIVREFLQEANDSE